MKNILLLLMVTGNFCFGQIINSDGILVSATAAYSEGSAVQRITFANLKIIGGNEKIPEFVNAYVSSKDVMGMLKNRNFYLVIKKNGENWEVINYWIREPDPNEKGIDKIPNGKETDAPDDLLNK